MKKKVVRSGMITFAMNHQYISLDIRCIHFIDYIETGWQEQDCERQLQCCGLWYGHKISDWLCFCDDFFLHCIEVARSPFNRRTWKYCILLYFLIGFRVKKSMYTICEYVDRKLDMALALCYQNSSKQSFEIIKSITTKRNLIYLSCERDRLFLPIKKPITIP